MCIKNRIPYRSITALCLAALLLLCLTACGENIQTPTQTQTEKEYTVEEFRAATTTAYKAPSTVKQGQTVYITPSGERYHYSPTCGGKNSYEVTMDEALKKGRTPCKKCAGG